MTSQQRSFAAGSRQAPDPYDKFLEQVRFYRKHTARDPSSLFRVISEQLFDTQQYHERIRDECVKYMRKNKEYFQGFIKMDIDDYLSDFSKLKSHGTMLELRALAYRYQRNVVLYEAFNLGDWFIYDKKFTKQFCVFFTPENHFDSVFKTDYVEDAGFCQALCYEVLYKKVFKLPDICYAVERMLHDSSGVTMQLEMVPRNNTNDYKWENCSKKAVVNDGREFIFDSPENTNCILDNHLLCHFHNKDFLKLRANLDRDAAVHYGKESGKYHDFTKANKLIDSLLPDKHLSCVIQLLNEGITPFPYKVAKALDPYIYRNIEFDAWSEMRKELRLKNWYTGGTSLQVGVKCRVRLSPSDPELYNCHIQDMEPNKGPCTVYIEKFGQKHTIPFGCLEPLPPGEAKPWLIPIKYGKDLKGGSQNGFDHDAENDPKKRRYKMRLPYPIYDVSLQSSPIETPSLKQFTSFHHFRPYPIEATSMPALSNQIKKNECTSNSKSDKNSTSTAIDGKQESTQQIGDDKEFEYINYELPHYTPVPYYPGNNTMVYPPFPYDPCYMPATSATTPLMTSSPAYGIPTNYPPPAHIPSYYNGYGGGNMVYNQNGQYYPSSPINALPMQASPMVPPPAFPYGPIAIRRRDLLQTQFPVNLAASYSYSTNGSDLPLNDVSTLRFFYNLGQEYFQGLQSIYGPVGAMTLIQDPNATPIPIDDTVFEINRLTMNVNNLKMDNDTHSNSNDNNSNYSNNSNGNNYFGKQRQQRFQNNNNNSSNSNSNKQNQQRPVKSQQTQTSSMIRKNSNGNVKSSTSKEAGNINNSSVVGEVAVTNQQYSVNTPTTTDRYDHFYYNDPVQFSYGVSSLYTPYPYAYCYSSEGTDIQQQQPIMTPIVTMPYGSAPPVNTSYPPTNQMPPGTIAPSSAQSSSGTASVPGQPNDINLMSQHNNNSIDNNLNYGPDQHYPTVMPYHYIHPTVSTPTGHLNPQMWYPGPQTHHAQPLLMSHHQQPFVGPSSNNASILSSASNNNSPMKNNVSQ